MHRLEEPTRALEEARAQQADIAIENVRLLQELTGRTRELTEALEQQTATGDILRVISSSGTDLQPVFRTILASATRLCEANIAALFLSEGEVLTAAAQHNATPAFAEYLRAARLRPSRETTTRRAALERRAVHVHDLLDAPGFAPTSVHFQEDVRTVLSVPMLRDSALVGVITVWRREVRPFSARQITLLETFADQAVIAVQNARLFNELQTRTRDLTRSVEQLTALSDVGRAVGSTLDLEQVLQTIVSRANQLAATDACSIYEYDEATEEFRLRAAHNFEPALVEVVRAMPLRRGEGLMGRAAEARQPMQVPDIEVTGVYQSHLRDVLLRAGYRALLSVPLLRDDQVIGSLSVNRKASEVGKGTTFTVALPRRPLATPPITDLSSITDRAP
jgi:GAF domain-containing protein